MKKILINATQKEELRIALIKNNKLYDLNIENNKHKPKKLNIYKGTIIKILQSLEAVFIDYGEPKYGFLPFKEIYNIYNKSKNYKNIKNLLYKGQKLIVQIIKEARKNKGAVLTTFITLISNNTILLIYKKKFCISKKIRGNYRKLLKKTITKIKLPLNIGLIIRTNAYNKSYKEIQHNIDKQILIWFKIQYTFKKIKHTNLIYLQNNFFFRIINNYLNEEIKEIIIDNYKIYKKFIKYINKLNTNNYINKIKFYNKEKPLFSYFKIENQIESAFKRIVKLPSGGSITIDITEALTCIDVNSSKFNKSNNIEITALNTNLEACKEIAKQLRFRNVGGIIVIDFIDMNILKNQKKLENKFKKIIYKDKAKTKICYISKLGLLEMSRQRLNTSLNESSYYICNKCKGRGYIRNYKSITLLILRIIQEKAIKKNTIKIYAILSIKIAKYIINKKQNIITYIKKKNIKLKIIKNKNFKNSNYIIYRIKNKNNYIKKNIKFNNNIKINKKNFIIVNNIYYNYLYKFNNYIYRLFNNLYNKINKNKKFIYYRIIYKK